ncbi:MerR family transcriptional regulator [Geotalea sp. SG265]|uniref:MerR family transcriptional regulator n=1 Tax=Geotalea sp. SG265 TaxID=2922867 RepID=UPI00325FD4F0
MRDKLFYKIGEVSELTALRPSVLRFWETEFPALSPKKSKSGQRLYSSEDLEVVKEIKQLLYDEKLTIDGARRRLVGRSRNPGEAEADGTGKQAEQLKQLLRYVVAQLKDLRDTI